MNCSRVGKLLSDYVDDSISASVGAELEAHLAQCEGCSQELKRLRLMLSNLKLLACFEAGADCWPEVRSRILTAEKFAVQPWWRLLMRPVALGPAMAVIILLVGFLFWSPSSRDGMQTTSLPANEYRSYITVHSRVQRQQALNDPDVVFITAQLENARLASNTGNK